ncbi:heat-shock protein HspX [Sulfolobus sp. A20-N-F6]|uniref:M48 family metallopeptidase n=1 Tax=Sulfolobaceae TaxID=118883 RepID=UPI000845E236|nr:MULTISPECIES: M56 family metallopeptidase [unclassified Sulfolobus]TRM74999.1 heat-shock protein HspX [Sulfolobus sp. E5]TRM75087.1 heat-shock protein HspX [Sulfolobus sp. A20-N-F8]TRM79636.1 heat-shock protein HspX [Sulfolobus sp. B5]TRM81552.1 heat-shock protein HspX [Sulfolobus sp. D5]TRM83400.1 heat-shock protein HspX [Sulfolobus sp. A20-N-F6]TRM89055.1 heat-shock protein HspX [Sulfolobus sp. E3]TRM89359.1 heat-shock protein HspX [Sulfolobus sp. C3]TRN00490.1 heat-shock protein HspX 
MNSVTTYWWKYYLVSFFSIFVIALLVSTLTLNIPFFLILQIFLIFFLWYLVSPFIMIITFKMKKANDTYLISLIENLSNKFEVKKPKVYVINDNFLNAFAFGNVLFRGIAITLPLIDALTSEELTAVLAHEISHIRNFDPETMLVTILCVNLIYSALLNFIPIYFITLLILVYILLLLPLVFYVHRKVERRADLTVVKKDPSLAYWLESSLIKIGYLSRNIPVNMLRYVMPIQILFAKDFILHNNIEKSSPFSFRTHPSLKERLEYLSKYEGQKLYYV